VEVKDAVAKATFILECQPKMDAAREGTLTIPDHERCNEQVTNVYQASLERVGGKSRTADGEVSRRRRGFHALNRLKFEMAARHIFAKSAMKDG
jgi:hypothetical protein